MPDPEKLLAGRYQLVKAIGQGGMSVVVLATDIQTGRNVAVKALSSSPSLSDEVKLRFRKEARLLTKLSHPNIVSILDYGEFSGRPCLILEWVGGGTLADQMGKPLPVSKAASLLIPVAHALQYAHEQGVIHRDVKPSNILFTEDGEVRLTDFGIAKAALYQPGSDLTNPGTELGTPEYMAPEQALGSNIGPQVDVYALGVILYELVTGRKPYKADTPFGTMLQHSVQPLPPARNIIPDLPVEVERVLYKALAKDPSARYQSMADFAIILEKLAQGEKLTIAEAPVIRTQGALASFLKSIRAVLRTPLPFARQIPVAVPVALLVILLIMGSIFLIKPGQTWKEDQLAYLSIVQGDAQISDGMTVSPVVRGALLAKSPRTLLKTGQGYIHLELRDGSFVILDAGSEIEFNLVPSGSSDKSYRFNILKGRALAINALDSPSPLVVQLGGLFTASVSHASMGLLVQPGGSVLDVIDCLVGPCQVGSEGSTLSLQSGQSAHVGSDGLAEIVEGIGYDSWALLGGVAVPSPTQKSLLANLPPTDTRTQSPTKLLLPITGSTPTIFSSQTVTQTGTISPTASQTKMWLTPLFTATPPPPGRGPAATSTPTRPILPTATRLNSSQTSIPPTSIPPTTTSIPQSSDTFTPQPTSIPSDTGPTATFTRKPTNTKHFTNTPRPTNTPLPPTDTFTPVPPSDTPIPPTDTPVPPTETPTP